MRIIRMEAIDGHGPFDGMNKEQFTEEQKEAYITDFVKATGWARIYEDWLFGFKAITSADDEHPHHETEGLYPDSPNDAHEWRVGVKDMDEFLHWFPEKSFKFFRGHGFCKATYEVPDEFVHTGRRQTLFCLDQAKLVKREALV